MANGKDTPRIKGIAFIEVLKWYAHTYGQARLTRIAHAVPTHLGRDIRDPNIDTLGLLPASWYPTELVQFIFQQMSAGLPPSAVRQLATDAAKAAIGNTLTGIYATFLRMMVSPKMIADNFQRIWSLYQSAGRCQVLIHAPNHHELRISEWPGHDPFFCQMVVAATKIILELTGRKSVVVTQIKCVDRRDAYCAYSEKWAS